MNKDNNESAGPQGVHESIYVEDKKDELEIGEMVHIEGIGNYYGGLVITEAKDGKYYWGIENYNGIEWDEISQDLFQMLKSKSNE